ncbi:MAG TPA: zf-HC2 domain-containing protein [Vicinamibacterales bacterium]|nr:zf-HC2 domain-containing protein [Vicinamibacterales bacterium]
MTHQHAIETMASERYLLGEMDEQERDRFEAHYFECADCAEDIRTAGRIRREVRKAAKAPAGAPALVTSPAPFANTARVIRPVRSAWLRPAFVAPWAVAASLALVLGYQSLVTLPELRTASPTSSAAVAPTLLRGATRGPGAAEIVVPVPTDRSVVPLAVEVIAGPETRQLSLELRSAAGSALVSGRTPVPSPGVSPILLVPADRLDVPARYTVVVRDADRPQAVLGEYAFVTSR